jgi:hypothetical protein
MKAQRMWVGGLMVAVFLTCFAVGTVHAQPGVFPDLSIWTNTWFKLKLTVNVYSFDNVGVKPKPSAPVPQNMGTAYINITNWDGINHILTADIYAKDHETGQWIQFLQGLEITYFAGSDLKFIGSAQLVTPDDVTMSILFVFTGKKYLAGPKAGDFMLAGVTKLGSIGSSVLEIDDALGSTERWAGSLTVSGPMVPESSLPFTPVP